jgi:hypothetical protein
MDADRDAGRRLKRQGENEWTVARIPLSNPEPRQLGLLIGQTLLLYALLVGGLAWLLRRITRRSPP